MGPSSFLPYPQLLSPGEADRRRLRRGGDLTGVAFTAVVTVVVVVAAVHLPSAPMLLLPLLLPLPPPGADLPPPGELLDGPERGVRQLNHQDGLVVGLAVEPPSCLSPQQHGHRY